MNHHIHTPSWPLFHPVVIPLGPHINTSPHHQYGREGMAVICAREGSVWILGKSSPKEWLGTGTGCPGKQYYHHPWMCSRNVGMWYKHGLVGNISGLVGLSDVSGLLQP